MVEYEKQHTSTTDHSIASIIIIIAKQKESLKGTND